MLHCAASAEHLLYACIHHVQWLEKDFLQGVGGSVNLRQDGSDIDKATMLLSRETIEGHHRLDMVFLKVIAIFFFNSAIICGALYISFEHS